MPPTSPTEPPPAQPTSQITHRTLAPDEAALAVAAGGPLAELGADPARLASMAIAVVEIETDGQREVVAYWVCWYGLHLEPLWIREDARRHPAVVGGLLEEVRGIVAASGEPAAFSVIEGENLEVVGAYAERLGFQEAPGKLYYLVLPAAEPVKG